MDGGGASSGGLISSFLLRLNMTKRKCFVLLVAAFVLIEMLIIGTNQSSFSIRSFSIPSGKWQDWFKGLELDETSASGSGSGSEIEDEELNLEIGDMAYPAEVRMKLFNIYPENYKDRVEKLEKFLKIDPLPKIHEEVKVAEEASAV